MNITTFLFCDCGYEQALNEGEQYVITQCRNCYTLASTEKKFSYYAVCSACGEKEILGENVTFEEKECKHCGLTGNIGSKELNLPGLFEMEMELIFEGNCQRCHQNNWMNPEEINFICPMCRQRLKQKMSNYWEE